MPSPQPHSDAVAAAINALPESAIEGSYSEFLKQLHPDVKRISAIATLRMLAHLRSVHKDDGEKLKSLAWLEELASLNVHTTQVTTKIGYERPPQ